MRNLDHPNIVKLVDFSESRQYYYILLELCPGGELFHQIVRLTYFSEDLSRHVIVQVAKAIEYLHEISGVVHRCVAYPATWDFDQSLLTAMQRHKTREFAFLSYPLRPQQTSETEAAG